MKKLLISLILMFCFVSVSFAASYKAIITSVSSVDYNGSVEVAYDVYIDGVNKYPNIRINSYCDRVQLKRIVLEKLAEIKKINEEYNLITVGTEITLQ